MKPIQIKLRREFKALNIELDDILINITVPKAEKTIDELMQPLYKENLMLINGYKHEVLKLKNIYELTNEKYDELYEFKSKLNLMQEKINNTINIYLSTSSLEELSVETKPIVNKMQILSAKAAYISDMKQALYIQCSVQSVIYKISDIINLASKEMFDAYSSYLSLEITDLNKELEKHYEYLETTLVETEDKPIKKSKIFKYRDMNKFAIKNGFYEVRNNGDHKMFSDGKYTVPIPQHELGKGLSIYIQKEIIEYNKKSNIEY